MICTRGHQVEISNFTQMNFRQSWKEVASPHLDPLALLLRADGLVVFVIPLRASHANRHLVFLAEHRQRLVVVSAEVAIGEGGRIRQPVPLQSGIPHVWRQVKFTVGRLAHEAGLDRCGLVSVADVTENFFSLQRLVWGVCVALNVDILLLVWRGRLRPFDLN